MSEINDLSITLEDMDAGVFADKCAKAVRDVAHGVATHGGGSRKGKITIELTLSRMGQSSQVMVQHKVALASPTARGKVTEEDTTETPMHVAKGGLTFMPEDQDDWVGRSHTRDEGAKA